VYSDPDAEYHSEHFYNLEELVPMIAKPHSPDNKATAEELEGTYLDRAYIGSCTGGKLSDFRAAAEIIRGQQSETGHLHCSGNYRNCTCT
jgi:3-isopropylmalate/(R)-2-methylmalate dehydratase large subunit